MNYKALILDLDGTVYVDGKPIKDIISKLNRFKEEGNKLIYLSNNTTVSRSIYYKKLTKLGLNVSDGEVVTPITIAGAYLAKKYKKGYTVGTKSFLYELEQCFNIIQDEINPEFVLITFDNELTYEKLKIACQHINNGVPYYITHIDLACPSEKGPIPDCGSISLLVESTTNKKPCTDFGKPSNEMVDHIQSLILNIPKSEVLMGGDRLYTDIALGNKLGVQTLLVLTGESKLEDIGSHKYSKFNVNHCSETLADFMDDIEIEWSA
ncbi:HAD-IIA family hydrolase [Arenibacter sp. TNZ]|jgi:HAD superfamily hydrolase (TIGR01450 family)|uniref:HAD-IIA family hydrolase n=1 Tax=Arenibacter TaxID=178469 RepID=UPI000CD49846|nr:MULTISPECIES: HAD-IIA family hydrolase [Arenibacter]MCM4172242.1 HAD-IIA family hydrolase [Arenibacter sp. TNZ]